MDNILGNNLDNKLLLERDTTLFSYLVVRNGHCHYLRRVPKEFSHIDSRTYIKKSLKTKNPQEGLKKALNYNDLVEADWQKLMGNIQADPFTNFINASKRAEHHGFTYKTAPEISEGDIDRIVNRLFEATKLIDSPKSVSAILGGQHRPKYALEQLWSDYDQYKKHDNGKKDPSQLRKWRNPKMKAFRNFISVCGDISVYEIERKHILNFRAWWSDRIQDEELSTKSANKDFSHLRSLLAYAQDYKTGINFDVTSLFARIRFQESESERLPFETSHIISKLLNHDNLIGLNEECKLFLFAMADTGARPSELVGLNPDRGDIQLNGKVPHIIIRPDKKREIKNKYSERKIPLVGAALYAFRKMPNGFKRYFKNADNLSANLNSYLREHGLLPSENHTLYSLRHSFEDRLTEIEPPEKVQSFLMGHKYRRERYGNGPSLEQKNKWLSKMCFKELE